MDWLTIIRKAFDDDSVLYSQHARREMEEEKYGIIRDEEVWEAIRKGEVIEIYEEEKPYPCVLVYGRTSAGRPVHVVSAVNKEGNSIIIVTVYQPDPARWIDFRHRRTP